MKSMAKARKKQPPADTRPERDSFGPIDVPADRLWGAQTERSLRYFAIGEERIPWPLVRALIEVKIAAARVNGSLGQIPKTIARAIERAGREFLAMPEEEAAREFPLSVWQTGSGTQTNMNVNEVLANRASEIMGGRRGEKKPVHPNDHVNAAQSSNDAFPTAMHIAAAGALRHHVLPTLGRLHKELAKKAEAWAGLVKTGRTHMQDATPVTLGQEFSGYAAQVAWGIQSLEDSLGPLYALALGGTAVGTGLNAPADFDARAAAELKRLTGLPFKAGENKFAMLAGHEAILQASGALNGMAASLFKIANDIRLMGSGPRAGLGELILPENEPGSSIMPGKVNPTQVEALTQVCIRVIANHQAITMAATQGHFELNVYKPLIIQAFLQSARLLADAADSFNRHCLQGLKPNKERLAAQMNQSLMLVTALAPVIGYDKAAQIARRAHENGQDLRQAALDSGYVDAPTFDKHVDPRAMLGPHSAATKRRRL